MKLEALILQNQILKIKPKKIFLSNIIFSIRSLYLVKNSLYLKCKVWYNIIKLI